MDAVQLSPHDQLPCFRLAPPEVSNPFPFRLTRQSSWVGELGEAHSWAREPASSATNYWARAPASSATSAPLAYSFNPFSSTPPPRVAPTAADVGVPLMVGYTAPLRGAGQGVRELEEAHAAKVQQLTSKAEQLTIWWEQVRVTPPPSPHDSAQQFRCT